MTILMLVTGPRRVLQRIQSLDDIVHLQFFPHFLFICVLRLAIRPEDNQPALHHSFPRQISLNLLPIHPCHHLLVTRIHLEGIPRPQANLLLPKEIIVKDPLIIFVKRKRKVRIVKFRKARVIDPHFLHDAKHFESLEGRSFCQVRELLPMFPAEDSSGPSDHEAERAEFAGVVGEDGGEGLGGFGGGDDGCFFFGGGWLGEGEDGEEGLGEGGLGFLHFGGEEHSFGNGCHGGW
mmetsp:Transcript_31220/g.63671  ORF Transcript_31220/g.63671 Transcript_31220/m.63671 type:complete len:235 (-) Transcript_31220:97-801(-)